jgi:hypothetical protein
MDRASIVTIVVDAGEDSSPDDLDALTRQLGTELRELDIESVALASAGDAPEGAKSGDVAALGALVVQLFPSVVPPLIGLLQAWSLRGHGRSVTIKIASADRSIELQYPVGTSEAELDRLIARVTAALGTSSTT